MTEPDWWEAESPVPLLELAPTPSERKLRLFGVACLRQNWDLFTDPRMRNAVVVGERFADGRATEAERVAADGAAWEVERVGDCNWHLDAAQTAVALTYTRREAGWCAGSTAESSEYAAQTAFGWYGMRLDLLAEQARFARCIFGNPFRPVALDRAWLTSTVIALATGIYEERAFDRLSILSDALMDAGCDEGEVLRHCRGEGPHARGCWVVDLLLGRA